MQDDNDTKHDTKKEDGEGWTKAHATESRTPRNQGHVAPEGWRMLDVAHTLVVSGDPDRLHYFARYADRAYCGFNARRSETRLISIEQIQTRQRTDFCADCFDAPGALADSIASEPPGAGWRIHETFGRGTHYFPTGAIAAPCGYTRDRTRVATPEEITADAQGCDVCHAHATPVTLDYAKVREAVAAGIAEGIAESQRRFPPDIHDVRRTVTWGSPSPRDGYFMRRRTATSQPHRVVYVAHRLGAPTAELRAANLAAATVWVKAIAALGFAPVASWILFAPLVDEGIFTVEEALAMDCALVERCDELWLVGPVLSPGMIRERDHAMAHAIPVRDFLRLDSPQLADGLESRGVRQEGTP
jgi:hypothetical protein